MAIQPGTIADFFLLRAHETGDYLTNLKLQKLVYYAQAWRLALYDESFFDEDFQAWVHGPVLPSLYERFKNYQWRPISEQPAEPTLTEPVKDFLNEVLDVYMKYSAYELERIAHNEDPWRIARSVLPDDGASTAPIPKDLICEYFRARADQG